MIKQVVLAYCRHSGIKQTLCAVVYVLNKLIGIKHFFPTVFLPIVFFFSLLPGANFLPGIQNSSLSEPSDSRLRTTDLANIYSLYGVSCLFISYAED